MLSGLFGGIFDRLGVIGALLFCALVPFVQAAETAAVGQVTLSIGSSQIQREGKAGPIVKGTDVAPGDVIRTAASGHVHIRFVDGARVSVRPDSVLHVVEYRYDAANPTASQVKFYLETGTVREISGIAAESARDHFRLNTPLVAIGVKGTDFLTQVTGQSTVVVVNQGAIALSPFDAVCLASGVGACSTSRTRELTAAMQGMALIYRHSEAEPVLQPVNSLKGADKITPILIQEHMGAAAANTTATDSRSPRAVSDVVATPVPAANPPTAASPAAVPPAPPVVAIDPVTASNSLVWGRWPTNRIPGDAVTVAFLEAMQGNHVTVGDGYYFLFRNENVPNLLAGASGTVGFNLQGGSASYRAPSNEYSVAAINSGALSIDFAHNTYTTSLSLSSAATGVQGLVSSGTIDPASGIFISAAADVRTAGAVSLDLRQAGYFFTKPVGNGALVGTTLWGR